MRYIVIPFLIGIAIGIWIMVPFKLDREFIRTETSYKCDCGSPGWVKTEKIFQFKRNKWELISSEEYHR